MLDVMVPSRGPLLGHGRKGKRCSRLTPLPCAAWSPFVPLGTPCSRRVLDVKGERCSRQTPSCVRLGPLGTRWSRKSHLSDKFPLLCWMSWSLLVLDVKRERCSKQTPQRLCGFAPLGTSWNPIVPSGLGRKGERCSRQSLPGLCGLVPLGPP